MIFSLCVKKIKTNIIVKKITLLPCPVSKRYKGIDIAPIIDDNDEYLVNINITIQLIVKIVPNKIFIENKIPKWKTNFKMK